MSTRQRPEILIVEFFSRGGLFHYALQLGLALGRQGRRVAMLTGRKPELMPPPSAADFVLLPRLWTWDPRRQQRPGAFRRSLHALRYTAAWVQILWFVRRLRPRAVLLGDLEHRCDAWFCRLLRGSGGTLADVCHNVVAFDRRSRAQMLRRERWRDRLLANFDCVFVHGTALADELAQRNGCRPLPIPHGAGDFCAAGAGADPDLRTRLQLPETAPVALLFGTLTKYKGVRWLLTALAAVAAHKRPFLVIAGFPAADASLAAWQAEARQLGIERWVRWHTEYIPWTEVAWYFRLAAFVVLPYYHASQSGVAHLALSFARPIVASNVGALPEAVAHGVNGLIVPVGDVAALAQAIEELAGAPERCQAMGQQAAQRARELHDWDAVARRVCEGLAAPPGRRAPEPSPGLAPFGVLRAIFPGRRTCR